MDEAAKRAEVTRLLKRGLNHYGLGDLEAAIRCWEKARELAPDNRAAQDYLETAYEESGRAGASAAAAAAAAGPEAEEPQTSASSYEFAFDDDETPRTNETPPPLPAGASLPDLPVTDEAPDTLVAEALESYKAGELESAWVSLQRVATAQPERLDVQGYLVMVRSERARQWAREVGDQGRAPKIKRSMQELMTLNLSPDEGFLLSQIDGELSIEMLLNLSSDRVRTLEILAKFIKEGLIE